MARRFLVIMLAAALAALSACAEVETGGLVDPRAESAELLYVASPAGFTAVDGRSGTVAFESPSAVAVPDWSRLFSAEVVAAGKTRLVELDPETGIETWSASLEGELTPRVVSPSGDSVALTPGAGSGQTSTIVVAHTTGAEPQTFEVAGNVEPEAFAADSSALFVLQYFPAEAPVRYQVRRLDLWSGELSDVVDLNKVVQAQMEGTAHSSVAAPDGRRLYTLYVDDDPEPTAFIHVVSLDEQWAHCVFLRHGFAIADHTANALAISPDGSKVYVVDATQSSVAVVDAAALAPHMIDLEEPLVAGPTLAAAGRDTLYVSNGEQIHVLDATRFERTAMWPVGEAVSALATSGDGTRLYAATAGRTTAFDTETGAAETLFEHPMLDGQVRLGASR